MNKHSLTQFYGILAQPESLLSFLIRCFFKPVILIRQMTCFRLEQCLIDLFFILPSHIDDKMYFYSVFLLDFFHCCFCPYQSLSFYLYFKTNKNAQHCSKALKQHYRYT